MHLSPFGLRPWPRRSRGGQFTFQVGLNRLEDTMRDVTGELVGPASKSPPGLFHITPPVRRNMSKQRRR